MVRINPTAWNFSKMASNEGKQLMSLPLKDNSFAKVLWNNNAVDCYIEKNGVVSSARGVQGPVESVQAEFCKILDSLQSLVKPKVNVEEELAKASLKKY